MVFKVGYTPYASIRNEYICDYKAKPMGNYGPNLGNDFTTVQHQDAFNYYGGSVMIAAGITHDRVRHQKFETMLFYERSVGTVGTQGANMQLAGVRAAYWFLLR